MRKDATLFNEIVIDVNTMYFERNGGYEYAKQFYEEAYHFIEEKFGADNIISAVMHADEINVAATEELGKDLRIAKIGTYKVIVNDESKFYADGDTVTVKADEPAAGKVFKGWKDASGNIVSTEMNYTFKVTGETALTAVYEDKPAGGDEINTAPEKKGLSGGAVAGIAAGSVAVAGLGGFSIFWFAVKKKSFADIIAAIKGTPKND